MVCSDGLQHRSSWPINNSIPLPPSYLSSMPPDVGPYSLTASGYPLQHSADGMVSLPNGSFHICSCISILLCSVLFFSRPWSEGWPHHEDTFSIYLCPLSLWLTLPWGVLSTSWCCPSGPCMVFFACMHLTLFLALHFYTTHTHTPV